MLSYIHQEDVKRFLSIKYLLYLAVTLNYGVVGTLHQRGNIGMGQVEQIEAAIVNVDTGKSWIGIPETNGELGKMTVGSHTQVQQLLLV